MKKVVNILHWLIGDGDVIEDKTIDQPVLHPPEDILLVLKHVVSLDHDVLENISIHPPLLLHKSHLEGYPVQVSWSSLTVLRVAPGRVPLHHHLEVHVGGSGVLHHDVPEDDGAAPRARSLAPHVEESPAGRVVKLGPGVDHGTVLDHQGIVTRYGVLMSCSQNKEV